MPVPVPPHVHAVGDATGDIQTATHSAVSVGVTSTALLSANGLRLYGLFVNDSDTPVYLALGAAAALNAGIRLAPNGGAFEMGAKFGNLYTGAVNAISSAANKKVLITEGI